MNLDKNNNIANDRQYQNLLFIYFYFNYTLRIEIWQLKYMSYFSELW